MNLFTIDALEPASVRTQVVKRGGLVLLATGLLGAVAFGQSETAWVDTLNVAIPVVIGCVCGAIFLSVVVRGPHMMAMPAPWFFAACGGYFSLGALANVFSNDRTIEYINSFYRISALGLLRTNILNAVSIAIVCLVYWGGSRGVRHPTNVRPKASNERLMLLLCFTALPAKYFLLVPKWFHLLNFVPPSSIASLGIATHMLLLLLWYEVHAGKRKYLVPAIAFLALELVVGLASFSKLEVLTTLFATFLAFALHRPTKRTLVVGAAVVVSTYLVLVPFVREGRKLLAEESVASLEARSAVLSSVASETNVTVDERQNWWSRLSYNTAQAFAMDAYDRGYPGTSFDNVAMTLVPRWLWHDKPIRSLGQEFSRLATGDDETASAPGIFAEGYWNLGWPGVVLVCVYVGIFFAGIEAIAMPFVLVHDFRWLVSGFFSLLLALRPDDWFVPTYITGTIFILACLLAVLVAVPAQIPANQASESA